MTSLPEHSGPFTKSVVHEKPAAGARDIAVIGAGSVGRVLTGRLSAAGHQVTLVARERQLAALRKDGIRLQPRKKAAETITGFDVVSELPAGATFTDVALAVRADQLAETIETVRSAGIRARSLVLCPPIWAAQPTHRIEGIDDTWVLFPGFLAGPDATGLIQYRTFRRPTEVGPLSGPVTPAVRDFVEALAPSGIPARTRHDMGNRYTNLLGAGGAWALANQLSGFDLAALAADRRLRRLAARATREAIKLTEARSGHSVGLAATLSHISPLIGLLGRLMARGTRSGWGAVAWKHRQNVAPQDRAMLAELYQWATSHGHDAPALKQVARGSAQIAHAIRQHP